MEMFPQPNKNHSQVIQEGNQFLGETSGYFVQKLTSEAIAEEHKLKGEKTVRRAAANHLKRNGATEGLRRCWVCNSGQ